MIEYIEIVGTKSYSGVFDVPSMITFIVKSANKKYKYRDVDSSPYIVNKFKLLLGKKAYGKALQLIKPFIKK
jgi:hypothetical protein